MELYLFIYKAVLFLILLIASIYDIKKRIIPNKLILIGAISGISMNIVLIFILDDISTKIVLTNILLGTFAGAAPLLLAEIFSRLVSKRQSIGGGDIKLYAVSGIFLGFQLTTESYFILSLMSLTVIGCMILFGKIKRGEYIPFGPFISAAVFVSVLFKNSFY